LLFAFAPAWVFLHVVVDLVRNPRDAGGVEAIALVVSGGLLYFLALLSFRAFTGKGRASDGGLLPPWVMKGFIHLFGVIAVGIVVMGIYERRLVPIIGGCGYLLTAYFALADSRKKIQHDQEGV
jgi:hypothetical protein